ncbi:MAG: RNA polymerase sigma-70 factor ECF subfamily [Bacillota bacterium]|nr:MAG: RNA polymerase sigma-70 factor ECF subfamily [Bacillota bacterium]
MLKKGNIASDITLLQALEYMGTGRESGCLMQDRELVALCHRGKTAEYGILVERYQRLVFSIAYQLLRSREEAEDAAQEAFVKVYSRIISTADVDFLPYIRTTVTNLCLDRLRRQKTAARHLAAIKEEDLTEHSTPETSMMRSLAQQLLQEAVERLPDMYREILVMHYVAGHSYEAIAQIIDQPMSIVKNRIFRGKNILREIYLQIEGGVKG